MVALYKQLCIRTSKSKCPSWTPRIKLSKSYSNGSSSSNRFNRIDRALNRWEIRIRPLNRPRNKSIAFSSKDLIVVVRRSRQPYHNQNRNYKRRQRPQQLLNRALSLVRMSAPNTLIKSTRLALPRASACKTSFRNSRGSRTKKLIRADQSRRARREAQVEGHPVSPKQKWRSSNYSKSISSRVSNSVRRPPEKVLFPYGT